MGIQNSQLINEDMETRKSLLRSSFNLQRFVIRRVFDKPSAWTFTIPAVAELLKSYIDDGKGWIDPFAGENSPAEHTNDINPDRPAKHHMEAKDFCEMLEGEYSGILFDPPYSYRQISEHYQCVGLKATAKDTSYNFYRRVMDVIAPKIKMGGYAISFGWNSNGFGKSAGFRIEEILLIAHGMHHNDTIVTIEKKVSEQLNLVV